MKDRQMFDIVGPYHEAVEVIEAVARGVAAQVEIESKVSKRFVIS
jgi:hypothetical protein